MHHKQATSELVWASTVMTWSQYELERICSQNVLIWAILALQQNRSSDKQKASNSHAEAKMRALLSVARAGARLGSKR